MPKLSSEARLVTRTISKILFTIVFASVISLTMMFMKYRLVYGVKINNEDVGYVSSKIALENKIDDFVKNGDSENVGYVINNSILEYNLLLVKKDTQVADAQIFAQVKDNCDVYYKVYAVLADNKEEALVATFEEAQYIVDEVNKLQEDDSTKSEIVVEEKYLQEYELSGDIEVVVNDIYEPIKVANQVAKEIKSTPAAVKTVSEDVLLALKENLRDLTFGMPLNNPVITSRFGWRSRTRYHYGIDLAKPTGSPISVAEDGIITYAGWCGDYGYLVKVQHAGDYETYYGHCSKLLLGVGSEVTKGDTIALVGSTGRSSGPHLHFEIRYQGTPLNPEVFLYNNDNPIEDANISSSAKERVDTYGEVKTVEVEIKDDSEDNAEVVESLSGDVVEAAVESEI